MLLLLVGLLDFSFPLVVVAGWLAWISKQKKTEWYHFSFLIDKINS